MNPYFHRYRNLKLPRGRGWISFTREAVRGPKQLLALLIGMIIKLSHLISYSSFFPYNQNGCRNRLKPHSLLLWDECSHIDYAMKCNQLSDTNDRTRSCISLWNQWFISNNSNFYYKLLFSFFHRGSLVHIDSRSLPIQHVVNRMEITCDCYHSWYFKNVCRCDADARREFRI